MQYYYMKIFFLWEKVFIAGSRYEPAVMGAHHQRLAHASPPVYEPAVMNPLHHRRFLNRRWWPRYHHRLKSNGTQNRWWCTFRTSGDRGGCSSVVKTQRSVGALRSLGSDHEPWICCWSHGYETSNYEAGDVALFASAFFLISLIWELKF